MHGFFVPMYGKQIGLNNMRFLSDLSHKHAQKTRATNKIIFRNRGGEKNDLSTIIFCRIYKLERLRFINRTKTCVTKQIGNFSMYKLDKKRVFYEINWNLLSASLAFCITIYVKPCDH